MVVKSFLNKNGHTNTIKVYRNPDEISTERFILFAFRTANLGVGDIFTVVRRFGDLKASIYAVSGASKRQHTMVTISTFVRFLYWKTGVCDIYTGL